MKKAFNSSGKMYGGYSTHSLPTRNAEILSEDKKEIDRPKYVTENPPRGVDTSLFLN